MASESSVQVKEVDSALQGIDRNLAAGEFALARQLAAQARAQWPEHIGVALAAGRIEEAQGDNEAASAIYREAMNIFATLPWPAAALARVQLRNGEHEAAQSSFDIACQRGLKGTPALQLQLALARGRGDWACVREAAEALLAAGVEPAKPILVSLVTACESLGDNAAAAEAASRVVAIDPDYLHGHHILLRSAQKAGRGEEILQHYRSLAVLTPDDARYAVKAIRMLSLLGRPGEHARELDAAVRRWPNDPYLRLYIMLASAGAYWLDTIMREPAPHELKDATARAVAREAQQLRAAYQLAPSDSELRRPLVTDQLEQEVLIGASSPGRPAVLVFTAANDQFGFPIAVFDRYLAAMDVTGIYVRDFSRLLFLRGVASLADTYEGTQAAIRERVKLLGASGLCTMGISGGGLAAIRYGVELGASHVISFSGDTNRRIKGTIATIEDPDVKFIAWRVREKIPGDMVDVGPLLRGRSNLPAITLVYGEAAKADRDQASYLADIANVRLHPLAGVAEHRAMPKMASEAGFVDFLRGALGLAPAPWPGRLLRSFRGVLGRR